MNKETLSLADAAYAAHAAYIKAEAAAAAAKAAVIVVYAAYTNAVDTAYYAAKRVADRYRS